MCHNFMLPGVLILKFANILEILLIWENKNLLNHYGYNMAKKLFPLSSEGAFFNGKFIIIKILHKIIFLKK